MILKMPQCLRLLAVAFVFAVSAFSQSTEANFPTPLTSSTVSGTIYARAVGDARDTTYYFAFEGAQGDVFVNVSTKNLIGSIDVFSSDTTRSFTRIPVFADSEVAETGRIIYLRKSEKLLLRVQGRSPDEDPATFQVKFAGSFVAIANPKEDATVAPKLSSETLAALRPKPEVVVPTPAQEKSKPRPSEETAVIEKKEEVVPEPEKVEPTAPDPAPAEATPAPARRIRRRTRPQVVVTDPVKREATTPARKPPATTRRTRTATAVESAPDPLANVRLVIKLKNGETIVRALPDVARFSVVAGVLVVVGKDRTLWRYPMTDVASVTIH